MSINSRVVLGRVATAVTVLSFLALAACTPKEGDKSVAVPGTDASKPAATVNGTVITQKQVDAIMTQQAARGLPDTPETRKSVLDNLTLQLIVAQEASKKGLDKKAETMDQIEMSKQAILADSFIQDYIKTNPVTDAMLAAEYDKIKSQASGNQYKARHILVEKEDEAKDIIAKLKKDVKAFEGLAKAKSKDPGSKDKGGDLGWFDPRGMVPEFGAAVAKLEKNKFTEEPVKSQFGYHVILLEDTRENPVPTLEQVKPNLSQRVQQQNVKKLLDDLKAKAKIEVVAAPAATPSPESSAAPSSAPAPSAAVEAPKK